MRERERELENDNLMKYEIDKEWKHDTSKCLIGLNFVQVKFCFYFGTELRLAWLLCFCVYQYISISHSVEISHDSSN